MSSALGIRAAMLVSLARGDNPDALIAIVGKKFGEGFARNLIEQCQAELLLSKNEEAARAASRASRSTKAAATRRRSGART